MKVSVAAIAPESEALAFALTEPPPSLGDRFADLHELKEANIVSAERGVSRLLAIDGRIVIAAGAGPRTAVDGDALRDAAAAAARELCSSTGGSISWLMDAELELSAEEQTRAVVEGFALGAYDPARWKSQPDQREVENLTLISGSDVAEVAKRARVVAGWTNWARDLVNAPPNELTPSDFADAALGLAEQFESLSVEILGPEEMRSRGIAPLLISVGAGSRNDSRLIVLRHEAPTGQQDLTLGLAGKGITFDSGGLQGKERKEMEEMKCDMSGGAAVVAAVGAVAELGIPVRIVGVVASAENMPSGSSYRPGDIIRASNGKTIEITDTDAEGRLVLADALVHARAEGATDLVSIASISGVMAVALGDVYAGVFANDEEWRATVVAAGEASGDHAWPWPMHPRHRKLIDSAYADLRNLADRDLGMSLNVAAFLKEFVGDGRWAHVDMAGPSFLSSSRGDYLSQVGGTGYGVRLLVELSEMLAR